MADLRIWILKILDGLLTLIGEIIVFFGVYEFLSSHSLSLAFFGLFALVLGQLAGAGAVRYEDGRKLQYHAMEVLENIGRQFAYPVLIFALYVMDRNTIFLALAFATTLIAFVKSLFILYKARTAESILS